jgi:hypothetical protein
MKSCTNCNNEFEGNYCNDCGQKAFEESDKSIRHILADFFHAFTNFDKGFLKTIFTVVRHPGRLSIDYCSGKQKTYFRPVSLFLIVVIAYLFSPFLKGMQPDFAHYASTPLVGKIMETRIESKLITDNVTFEVLRDKFNAKSEITSKLSLFILIPFAALLILLLFSSRKSSLYDAIILSIEVNIYYLFMFFIALPWVLFLITKLLFWAIGSFGITVNGVGNGSEESLLSIVGIFLLLVWYGFTIFNRFFGGHRLLTIIK